MSIAITGRPVSSGGSLSTTYSPQAYQVQT
jgi:hypothetical protein